MANAFSDTPNALYSLESRFCALYMSGIIGILRADMDRIIDANDGFLAMVGYTREEMQAGALRWSEMTPPKYAALDAHALQELQATGQCAPFEKEYFRKDGTRVPIQIAAAVVQADPLESVCYVVDLSTVKHAGEAERTLATIIEHVPVGVIVVDEQGKLLLMNGTGRQISGAAPTDAEMVAEQAAAYALREPRTGRPLAPEETPIARALAGETVQNYEYVFRPVGLARDRWVRTAAIPLTGELGQSLGAVAVFEDVTEERLRDQAREDFLSLAAHDLKTPLTGVKGFSQLLERRLAREGVLRSDVALPYLERISHTIARMEDQISELLDIARLQVGEDLELDRASTDLLTVVQDVATRCQERNEHRRITVQADVSVLPGMWDRRRIERVIENLLTNAITYSLTDGDITLTVRRQTQDGVGWAIVDVADRGIGIREHDLPHIFERFYRGSNVVGQYEGTGIGLAGVRQIVEQHGGRVTVVTHEGAGSTFSVWLPLDTP